MSFTIIFSCMIIMYFEHTNTPLPSLIPVIINYAPIKYSCGSFFCYSTLISVHILLFFNSKPITCML